MGTGGRAPCRATSGRGPPLHLAGFLVHDVLADDRVVLAQLDALLGVVAVLLGEVAVVAGLALELDGRAGFLRLGHDVGLRGGSAARRIPGGRLNSIAAAGRNEEGEICGPAGAGWYGRTGRLPNLPA